MRSCFPFAERFPIGTSSREERAFSVSKAIRSGTTCLQVMTKTVRNRLPSSVTWLTESETRTIGAQNDPGHEGNRTRDQAAFLFPASSCAFLIAAFVDQ